MNAGFLKLEAVKDWKKNIFPVAAVLFFYFLLIAAIQREGVLTIVCISFMTLAGTVSSITLLPKTYLAVISQLLIPPVIAIFGVICLSILLIAAITSDFNERSTGTLILFLIFILTVFNILSVLITMCIRSIYFNVLNKMSRIHKIIFAIFSLISYGVILYILAALYAFSNGLCP